MRPVEFVEFLKCQVISIFFGVFSSACCIDDDPLVRCPEHPEEPATYFCWNTQIAQTLLIWEVFDLNLLCRMCSRHGINNTFLRAALLAKDKRILVGYFLEH